MYLCSYVGVPYLSLVPRYADTKCEMDMSFGYQDSARVLRGSHIAPGQELIQWSSRRDMR